VTSAFPGPSGSRAISAASAEPTTAFNAGSESPFAPALAVRQPAESAAARSADAITTGRTTRRIRVGASARMEGHLVDRVVSIAARVWSGVLGLRVPGRVGCASAHALLAGRSDGHVGFPQAPRARLRLA